MKKAALYARVSSDRQEKERTIESQIAELKQQIARSGDTLVKEYTDDGHSGFYLDRPAMNQLREDLKTNTFEVVYFLAADRISRDLTYQDIIVEELIRHKKQIVIGGKSYIDNPENKFALTVFGAMSEYERAKIIERSMRGRKHWLKQGMLMSNGCKTFGYRYHRRTEKSYPYYEIEEREASIVREIFEMYAKGNVGLREIERYLKAKKAYRRPGSAPWNWNHIYHILRHEMYTGIRYFDTMTDGHENEEASQKKKKRKMVYRDRRDWIGISVPAIVPKEIFDTVQARLEHNKTCYRNAKNRQLLSGIMWCGKCGSPCWSFRQYYLIKRSRDLTKIYEKYLYTCSGRRQQGRCDTRQTDVRPIHTVVLEIVENTILNPERLKENIKITSRRINQQRTNKELKRTEQKIKDIDAKKNRVIDLYASGDLIKEEYLKRINQYDGEATSLKFKREELLKKTPVTYKPEAINTAIQIYCERAKIQYTTCANTANKQQFFKNFITRVTYRNNQITVEGLIPIETNGVEFVIKRKIDRVELRNQILQHDRKIGLRGSNIRRDHFGYLSANAKVVTPNI